MQANIYQKYYQLLLKCIGSLPSLLELEYDLGHIRSWIITTKGTATGSSIKMQNGDYLFYHFIDYNHSIPESQSKSVPESPSI